MDFFSFVSFPLLWLQHFILWNKEKSWDVYAAVQLTFKGQIRNLGNQYANSGHGAIPSRSLYPVLGLGPANHISQPARQADEEMDAQEAQRPSQGYMRLHMTKTGWDPTSTLLQSLRPSCPLLPLVPRSLPSLGDGLLLNKMKVLNLLPELCGSKPHVLHRPPASNPPVQQVQAQRAGPSPDRVNQSTDHGRLNDGST